MQLKIIHASKSQPIYYEADLLPTNCIELYIFLADQGISNILGSTIRVNRENLVDHNPLCQISWKEDEENLLSIVENKLRGSGPHGHCVSERKRFLALKDQHQNKWFNILTGKWEFEFNKWCMASTRDQLATIYKKSKKIPGLFYKGEFKLSSVAKSLTNTGKS